MHHSHVTAAQAFNEGRFADAEAIWRIVLDQSPGDANALVNHGVTLRMLGRAAEAWTRFQQALAIAPESVEALTNLAMMCDEQGQLEEAMAYYEKALSIRPTPNLHLLAATILPPVYDSGDEVQIWRRGLTAQLQRCHAEGIRLALDDLPGTVLFYLAYQGANDRDLQQEFARLHCAPPLPAPNPLPNRQGRRLRVGFISRHLREHTIGRLFHGTIARLDRQSFEVIVFCLGQFADSVTDFLRRNADAYIELPFDLRTARQAVLDQRLDLLFYCDIGMEPWSTALAHSRLAPVQCVTWGHPVTTGIETIDYFISSSALEIPEADEHYSETLVRLPRLFCYYERPRLPQPAKDRAAFGLPGDAHLYGCLQTIFKLHPEFDELLGAILRRDPRGIVTLVAGTSTVWIERLWRRFQRTIPDVLDRVRLLPSMPRSEYLQLIAVHDVLLDPIHFGGGNTSFEGFGCSVPIVTWPSSLLRGRITAALYEQMGMNDCIAKSAEEYVEMAVRLASDVEYRQNIVSKIERGAPQILENEAGIRDFESFLRRVLLEPRSV